jgi:hypothetical protein
LPRVFSQNSYSYADEWSASAEDNNWDNKRKWLHWGPISAMLVTSMVIHKFLVFKIIVKNINSQDWACRLNFACFLVGYHYSFRIFGLYNLSHMELPGKFF